MNPLVSGDSSTGCTKHPSALAANDVSTEDMDMLCVMCTIATLICCANLGNMVELLLRDDRGMVILESNQF